jgi:hypothetical protein
MTNEQIEKFMLVKNANELPVQINFKTRKPIKGLFIKLPDYAELKSKNLWRVVSESHIDTYRSSKDTNLARIFNGVDFTRLEVTAN